MKRLLEKLESQFDHIVLDSPPVLAVTDAVILSHLSDIALMVVRYGVTPQRALERGYAVLHDEGRTHVEVVLNAIDQKADSYATTYGYWEVARAEA
jgi:Mrp family chromosome partitioning ATPase